MFVLDTNTLIYFFKGTGNVAPHLLSHSPRTIGIPAIVLYELSVGIEKSIQPRKRRAQLNELLSVVSLLPFGDQEARKAAKIRVQLERQGTPIGPIDILIAATALVRNAVLVTHNTLEFERIAGLQLEDWY